MNLPVPFGPANMLHGLSGKQYRTRNMWTETGSLVRVDLKRELVLAPILAMASPQPQTLYTQATHAELAQNYDEAFRLYVRAAEGFLHLSRINVDNSVKSCWKKEAGRALERAEKIKGMKCQGRLRTVEIDYWSDGASMFSCCGCSKLTCLLVSDA